MFYLCKPVPEPSLPEKFVALDEAVCDKVLVLELDAVLGQLHHRHVVNDDVATKQ